MLEQCTIILSQATILNNGYTEIYFKLQRGVMQGCPLATSIFIMFIIILETLATTIPINSSIKDINTDNQEIKISLLAADNISINLFDLDSFPNEPYPIISNTASNIAVMLSKCSILR